MGKIERAHEYIVIKHFLQSTQYTPLPRISTLVIQPGNWTLEISFFFFNPQIKTFSSNMNYEIIMSAMPAPGFSVVRYFFKNIWTAKNEELLIFRIRHEMSLANNFSLLLLRTWHWWGKLFLYCIYRYNNLRWKLYG